VGVLLCGIGLFYHARNVVIFSFAPGHRITFTRYRPPVLVTPPMPRIPFTRD
jgi:hypothetical protein